MPISWECFHNAWSVRSVVGWWQDGGRVPGNELDGDAGHDTGALTGALWLTCSPLHVSWDIVLFKAYSWLPLLFFYIKFRVYSALSLFAQHIF